MVVVVADATAAQHLPLHLHRLRLCHTVACWSGPCPLPPTDRWCSRTTMPIQGVIKVRRVPSMVGIVPTGLHRSMTHRHRAGGGEEEGGEEEDDNHHISVVMGSIGASAIHQTAHMSISPQGRPQGPLAPQTTTTPPTSPTPSLATAGPPPALPSSEAGPLVSWTPLDLKSLCGNRPLHWFAHHATPFGKGRAPRSLDSMAGPSR
jgi:hypothetical protein